MGFLNIKEQWSEAAQAIQQAKDEASAKVGSQLRFRKESTAPQTQTALAGPLEAPEGFQTQGFTKSGDPTVPVDYQKKMREDYGWKMDEATFQNLEKGKADMESSISAYSKTAGKQIAQAKSQYGGSVDAFSASVKAAESQLNAAKAQLGKTPTNKDVFNKWYSSNLMKVSVVSKNGQKEHTYTMPREVVKSLADGGTQMTFTGKGEALVPVTQQGRMQGQELHESFIKLTDKNYLLGEFMKQPKWNAAYSDTLKSWKTASDQLKVAQNKYNTERGIGQSQLDKMNQQIQNAEKDKNAAIKGVEATRQGSIDAAKEAYAALSERRRLAYGNLAKTGGYTPNE